MSNNNHTFDFGDHVKFRSEYIGRRRDGIFIVCNVYRDALTICPIDGNSDDFQYVMSYMIKHVDEDEITLRELQNEMWRWQQTNFPNSDFVDTFFGLVEEVGELSHALLKQRQKIRGKYDEHEENAKDAVGDILVFLINLCNFRGWDIEEILVDTWDQVSKRNWNKNKENGIV